MKFTYRPLVWTGPRTPADERRSRWTFKAGWEDTLYLLERELDLLNATQAVFEADFREQDLRMDGLPRANARQPEFPGVRVAFNVPGLGRIQNETDSCAFWQHNVRSIALGLGALRAVDRYGITRGQQQYTGFKAIGGATPMPSAAAMTEEEALQFLASHSDSSADLMRPRAEARAFAYRVAARKLHPDKGGSTADFQRLQEAKRVLGI